MSDAYENLHDDSAPLVVRIAPPTITLEDVYTLLADMHSMEARKLAILEGMVAVINQVGPIVEQVGDQMGPLMEQLQESPLFGMLSGNGGGLLGGLFRR